MSKAGASGVSGCEGDIQSCGSAPGARRFWHIGIVLMLSVPPARTTRSMPAAIDPAAVAMAPRPAAQCRFVANPGTLLEAQHDGRVARDDPAALQALGDDEVVDLARLDLRALEDGSDHHLGELERVLGHERPLARAADRRAESLDDHGVLHAGCSLLCARPSCVCHASSGERFTGLRTSAVSTRDSTELGVSRRGRGGRTPRHPRP